MDEDELINAIIEDQTEKTSDDDEEGGPSSRFRRKKQKNRSKISTDAWTNDNIIKLITEVEIRPC